MKRGTQKVLTSIIDCPTHLFPHVSEDGLPRTEHGDTGLVRCSDIMEYENGFKSHSIVNLITLHSIAGQEQNKRPYQPAIALMFFFFFFFYHLISLRAE